ncbi:MAG: cupredoxin domain-containing protein [Armatimonadota bacterium]|nr:cupredoxin domain-containing protein [Armatimonadota bacterium]MDR7427304.1 cupredoxin domain-containing protein [Armatimonadota bacterium]MDR7463876.1 cupredoxin domain-containing protein [Armatimonadota bacterium]MDR7469926.1 cupredoxin domain-containing protein [Armatimonadota bacterium]MDR7474611.1 cupredoxin domain-containing protein [Armatimonadota bacterium]
MRTSLVILLVVAAGLAAITPLLGVPGPVALVATEFKWTPKDVTAATGEITFNVVNKGTVEHNFVIEDAKGKVLKEVDAILPGKSVQVRVTLKAGKYVIVCTVPGHREAGMVGTLSVK